MKGYLKSCEHSATFYQLRSRDVCRPKIFDLGRVIFRLLVSGQPSLAQENFPQKSKFYNFYPVGLKKSLQIGSKNIWVIPIFTAGLEVCSGHGPSPLTFVLNTAARASKN